jgi:hypothetical protein
MHNKIEKKILLVFILLFLTFNIVTFFLTLQDISFLNQNKVTAKSSQTAQLKFCINPSLDMESIEAQCGKTLYLQVNDGSTCNLSYNQTDNDTVTFSVDYPVGQPEILNITENGTITFKPPVEAWGENFSTEEHYLNIIVTESNHSCGPNQIQVFTYEPEIIFVNSPPEYIKELPNITMEENTQRFAYELSEYFEDRDEQKLSYSLWDGGSPYELEVFVENTSSGSVVLQSFSECGDYSLIFKAEESDTIYDEFVLNDPAALVSIKCEETGDGEDDNSGGGGGSSGGGSGIPSTQEECVPKWNCLSWSDCYPPDKEHKEYPNGYKIRECYDENGCDPNDYKRTLYAECNYSSGNVGCYPEWKCTDWTTCTKENIQKRSCKDLNDCSEEDQKRFGIPSLTKICVYLETCKDGMKNNGELGVDCGGPCEPCKEIQLPSTIQDNNRVMTILLGILLGFFLTLLILFRVFKVQIKAFISKTIWSLVKKKARQIFIIGKPKKKLLNEIKTFQDKLNKNNINYVELDSQYFLLFRKIIAEILSTDYELSKQEFIKEITKLDSTEEFKEMLIKICNKTFNLETNGRKINIDYQSDLKIDFNILKFLFYNVSDLITKKPDHIRLKFIEKTKLNKVLKIINNSLLALQNKNTTLAKNEYLKSIEIYESLDEKEKAKIYDYTSTLFSIIKYVNSHIIK